MLKCYKAFVKKSYRMLTWVIYPAVLLLICVLLQTGAFGMFLDLKGSGIANVCLVWYVMCVLEIIFDYVSFGGIYAKNSRYSDYLILSSRGSKIIMDAVKADIIKRILMSIAVALLEVGLCVALGSELIKETFVFVFGSMVCMYLFTSLAIFILRFCLDIRWMLMICYVTVIVLVVSCVGILSFVFANKYKILLTFAIIGIGLCVLVSIALIKMVGKKVRDKQYD